MTRRDSLGRRIGHNWWRAFITDLLRAQDAVWHERLECAGYGYLTESREFTATHPRPTLKHLLVTNAGMGGGVSPI